MNNINHIRNNIEIVIQQSSPLFFFFEEPQIFQHEIIVQLNTVYNVASAEINAANNKKLYHATQN